MASRECFQKLTQWDMPRLPTLPDKDGFWAKAPRLFRQRRAGKDPPAEPETLRSVRKRRRVSQSEVASRLGTSQSDISKLERRADLLVSTLTAYVAALGGSLELTARFPGLSVGIKLQQ